MGYAKLHEEIVSSSLWGESKDVKILWVTMLALADKHGEVMASVPGLARAAVLSNDEVRAAIGTLESPDPDSRTEDDEGRRLRKIEGGWELLNYAKYRWKASTAEAKESNRERQQRFRDRQKRNAVTPLLITEEVRYGGVTPYNAEAEAKAEADLKTDASASCPVSPVESALKQGKKLAKGKAKLTEQAEEIYNVYPRKVGRGAAIKAIIKALGQATRSELMAATINYGMSRKGEDHKFTPHPSTWFNEERYKDEIEAPGGELATADVSTLTGSRGSF